MAKLNDYPCTKRGLKDLDRLLDDVSDILQMFPDADNLKEMKSKLETQRAEMLAKLVGSDMS